METNPEYHLFNFESGKYKTLLTKKYANRTPYQVPDIKLVYAFIPGTILEIFVKEKKKVQKGEPLLIFQAMKMNNILKAPITGTIKKINVKPGERVPKSQVLIEFK
ncbi:MAG TPA: biotin/lipoyl-containing protein [Bacteroidales bacterium]|nr:biotin/lipoyl-containing protein [Bacteroidales bacterium]